MTKKHAWIVLGVLAAGGALVYLASLREVSATVTALEPTITYKVNATTRAHDDGQVVTVDVQ